MLTKFKKFKSVFAIVAIFSAFTFIVTPAPAEAVKPGPYVPQKYDSVTTDSGKNEDDLVCTIENASKVHCELHAGNFSKTCSIQGAGECNRRDYYYNPVKSAQIGRDVFEADQNEDISDAEKDKLWGYVVFPLSKTRSGADDGDYSTFTITRNYRNFTGAEALADTINGADESIKKAGEDGICSVILNKTEPTECTIGGKDKGNRSDAIGKKVSVASQKNYTSGAGNFVNNKGDDCEEGGALGFILCPIENLLNDAVTAISTKIVEMLNVKTSEFQNQELKDVFNNVLGIANGLFAIIFLVAIFSNALSIGIDNYTIKKIIPRLVAAVLLAQFSYYIAIAVIEIGNVLGTAIPQTLFNGLDATTDFNPSSIVTSLAGILFSIIFFLVALVAFLIGIFVLALRQIILIGIVLTGPIAFAAWVLPGTEKGFKFWWTNLLKLTLMYPIISTILVGSLYLKGVLQDSGGIGVQLGAAALPVIALLYLPKTFKWSGQLMSGTAGKISDYGTKKSKGMVKNSAKEGQIAKHGNTLADKALNTKFGGVITKTPMLGTAVQKNIGAREKRVEAKQGLENLPGKRLEKMATQGHRGAAEVLKTKYAEELDKQESRALKGQSVDATKLVALRTAIGGVEKPGTPENSARATTEANRLANAATTYVNNAPAGVVRQMPQITYSKKADGDNTVRDYFSGNKHSIPGRPPVPSSPAPGAPALPLPGPAVVRTAPGPTPGSTVAVPPPHGGHP